ncbi:Glycosyltransferase, GT2 family [Beijerinckiaceae bacterium RH AL1]|nr:glycosyltransferase family A protein [Beijerinckiaceae bacterium]VVB44718.1 Glycosyltransferase, GT2 family [Beijerinckiaceae bacterium RH CH11]VVB44796.1 Glycosyltransferase, GT2 family [Beijerinckiaceae bacterium RH AL8]VVC54500.1 Glycosyltransferase, GT2 family [Beijerinckiaceae bacterium RH AL1]
MATLSLAVCIATTGRPTILVETLRDVMAQTRRPERILACPAKPGDVDEAALAALPMPVEIVRGTRIGSSAQRNTILRVLDTSDIALFIDDDYLLAPSFLANLEALFLAEPDCVVATGHVLADGAQGPGYSVEEGRAIIAAAPAPGTRVAPVFNAYGCNMAVRWSALRGREIWFDEELPLYSWAEDVDFSRQAAAYGSVLKADALTGVHLATKTGRTSGVRFGYSQVANQVYLARKGTITTAGGLRKAFENIVANAIGAVRNDEAFIDRRGRLVGNLRGVADTLRGRVSPGRILDM